MRRYYSRALTKPSFAFTQSRGNRSLKAQGLVIGDVTFNCSLLNKEQFERLLQAFVRAPEARRPDMQAASLEQSIICALASRLKPDENLDFAQAVVEVTQAVNAMPRVLRQSPTVSGDPSYEEAQTRIGERSEGDDSNGATQAAKAGAVRGDQEKELKEKDADRRAKWPNLEPALQPDLVRHDAEAAAARVQKIVKLVREAGGDRMVNEPHDRQNRFHTEATNQSVSFQLEDAVRVARSDANLAKSPNKQAAAFVNSGASLDQPCARKGRAQDFEAAAAAYRATTEKYRRERAPLDWMAAQDDLDHVFETLLKRENGTRRLEEAVATVLAMLEEIDDERGATPARDKTNEH